MVNSGSFDSDVDRNEKDGFTQYNSIVESPQSVISMHAVSGSLCENDFTTQTADSLPDSQAIEPTATKTEYKCNMSEEIIRVSDNIELDRSYHNFNEQSKCLKETHLSTQNNRTQSFIAGESFIDRYINTGYLRKYKIETKPSICCSVPLERIPNVLQKCSNIIARRGGLSDLQNNKDTAHKDLCLYCDRSFLIPTMKQKHMNRFHFSKFSKRMNLRQQTTKCLYCDLDSSDYSLRQLFVHLANEHSEKYFACLDCEMRFSTLQLMEHHLITVHDQVIPFQLEPAKKPKSANATKKNSNVGNHQRSTIKSRVEYKRNSKINIADDTIIQRNEVLVAKTKRKCQSKYLNNRTKPVPSRSSTKTNDPKKLKPKFVKDFRNKKLAVISTKVGMKHCLRITRQRSKILENSKNTKKKTAPAPPRITKTDTDNLPTKYLPYQNSSFSLFDISYRIKKITDHSIDNLRISSLTFDDVFDKAFFNRVKCNIQENLLNFIDGKLFKSIESENRISSFQKTKDASLEDCNANCSYANTISTSDVLIDSQFGEESESQIDKPSKKKNVQEETGHYKYFTRRKYQAVISERKGNRDLSKLDIWTQLVMKNRQQKIISDQKTDKEMIEYKRSDEYKVKVQQEELNEILDKRGPLEDLKEEAMRTVALEKINSTSSESKIDTYFDVTIILNEIINNFFPKESDLIVSEKENCDVRSVRDCGVENTPQDEELLGMLNLHRTSGGSRSKPNENVFGDENGIAELTGEWARTRIYVCASCGMKMPNAKLLVDHKNLYHENVWCQHYEFVGNQGELYRHLSIPGLGKIGAMEDKVGKDMWRRSDARECSKCNKRFNCLGDLHRHMLECGGDLSWTLERKKYKYRPYGSKTRKKRRGLLRLLQSFRNHSSQKRKKTIKKLTGPRQKPSDADTIERMLANLPAKRITRKSMSLKDGFPRANKKILKSNVKVVKKQNKTVKNSVKTKITNKKQTKTRRLLRSNSSILLESNINLILPRFKRKKTEGNKIVRQHSLKSDQNKIRKKLPRKLSESDTKITVVNDTISISDMPVLSIRVNKAEKLSAENKDTDTPKTTTLNEGTIAEPEKIKETLISTNTTVHVMLDQIKIEPKVQTTTELPVRVLKRKYKKRKQNVLQKSNKKHKSKYASTINTMNLRNTSARKKVAKQKKKVNRKKNKLVKPKVTAIIQVDGSSHSKSEHKNKYSKRELNLSIENLELPDDSTFAVENNDLIAPVTTVTETNTTNEEETNVSNSDEALKQLETSNEKVEKEPIEDSIKTILVEEKDNNEKLIIPNPPATKKCVKKPRGLNDCIAMLTNKLQDKNSEPTTNVLDSLSLKSFPNESYSNKNIANDINNSLPSILNLSIEQKLNKCHDQLLKPESDCDLYISNPLKSNGLCMIPNGTLKNASKATDFALPENTNDNLKEINDTPLEAHLENNIEILDDQKMLLDIEVAQEKETKQIKHKVKHKVKETRKHNLLKNVVVGTDKLQEIQTQNNDTNTILNSNKALESRLTETDNVNSNNNVEKFSTSEKENAFNHSVIKILKPRKPRKRLQKDVLGDVAVLKSPNNHIDDVINAVATNDGADSEDEIPLSELLKKYVSDVKLKESIDIPLNNIIPINSVNEVQDILKEVSERVREGEKNSEPKELINEDLKETKMKKVKGPKNYSKRKKVKSIPVDLTIQEPIAEQTQEDVPEEATSKEQEIETTQQEIEMDLTLNENNLFEVNVNKENIEKDTVPIILNEEKSANNSVIKYKAPFKKKSKRGRKPLVKTAYKVDDESNAYCELCNKTFRRSENLFKHKRTLKHIAKLSELEALESKQNSEDNCFENILKENLITEQNSFENIDSVACDEYPQNGNLSGTFGIGSPQENLKLVDIISDVLNKPVEHRNFSNLILQSDPEIKRCKSLGERKSFDCDKLPLIDNRNTSPIPNLETNISGTTADVIVEKQISLLENMIVDNCKSSQQAFISSKLPITEDYSCQSNSSAFSMLSSNKQEDLNEITFTHNTNIISNLIKPNLEDNLISSTQYEQISDDSNSSHFRIDEQKSRKALNRDEELFLECCSLLKSSSDVSDLCRKSMKSTKFLNNFGLKPSDELDWMEQKQVPTRNIILDNSISNIIEVPETNVSIHSHSHSITENVIPKIYMEKNKNETFFLQPPIFEDISTESEGSSRKSVLSCTPIYNSVNDQSGFTINMENRSSPNVESAQIPFEEEKMDIDVQKIDIEEQKMDIDEQKIDIEEQKMDIDEQKIDIEEQKIDIEEQKIDIEEERIDKEKEYHFEEENCNINLDFVANKEASPTSNITKNIEGAKVVQTNITDYVVSKKIKKHESKKLLTKGALKVFEGLKVSIPKDELDMKEVLSCSPTSKRLEIEAEQDKLQEKKAKKETNRNFLINKLVKNGKKLNNKLGLKIKKRFNVDVKFNKIHHHELDKKTHDVYDFEETQDSVDMFIKSSNSLEDYHSFKNKITGKNGTIEADYVCPKSPSDSKKVKNNHCASHGFSSRKLKINKCITKKKCMIMGRIFKNALKSKITDEIKNIPVMDNTKIVEDFVMNCHDIHFNEKIEKPKLSEEEMNLLFDSLLNEGNGSAISKFKNDNGSENGLNLRNDKIIDKSKRTYRCKKRQRGNSSDSSDEEFSIKRITKKHLNKKPTDNDCVINLEQELKECIGVASRKSQRKCTSGKQNVLVEYWSSDESNFDFDSLPTNNIREPTTKQFKNDAIENNQKKEPTPPSVETNDTNQRKEIKDSESNKNKHFKRKKPPKSDREKDLDVAIEEHDSETTIASTRQKRNAVDTLYYWSSSSEDEMQDIIEIKSLREDCNEEDRPFQQGWIVGDSPKKLVTMLAQAKGKKLDIEYVKKNRKKRTSV